MADEDDIIEPTAEEIAAQAAVFQAIAEATDNAHQSVIAAGLSHPAAAAHPLAVLSGVVMAATRLAIQHGLADGEPVTVRNVLTVMLKASNQAAEALLAPHSSKH